MVILLLMIRTLIPYTVLIVRVLLLPFVLVCLYTFSGIMGGGIDYTSHLLSNVHEGYCLPDGVTDVQIVAGNSLYYHYGCDGFDDRVCNLKTLSYYYLCQGGCVHLCLFFCLSVCLFVNSLTQKAMNGFI